MEELREVMRKWTTGVSIVTATLNGFTHGMTVGSLVSLSIDPPPRCDYPRQSDQAARDGARGRTFRRDHPG